ncbi:MAG TPA: hypothetical protein VGS21_04075, partial [Acidimicrobiales bacterium]|nr:hypothetical protein [Acidimicrobiales bacterium]
MGLRKKLTLFCVTPALVLGTVLVSTAGGTANGATTPLARQSSTASSSQIGPGAPTFVGPAAAPCPGCSLLSGPIRTSLGGAASVRPASGPPAARPASGPSAARPDGVRVLPPPMLVRPGAGKLASEAAPVIPGVSCDPLGPGCDAISTSSGGATGVKGLDAVDSASLPSNVAVGDIEPPDQGLCAGHGYVVETNNIGEFMVFDNSLHRLSAAISDDTLMGLGALGWSSGGDPS